MLNVCLEGVNNLYKVKKKSAKSILFSEFSVLENMHCSKFFHLIQDPNLDILDMFKDNVSFNKTENINYKKGTKNDVQKAFGVFNPGN